jgi:hypothetical protein
VREERDRLKDTTKEEGKFRGRPRETTRNRQMGRIGKSNLNVIITMNPSVDKGVEARRVETLHLTQIQIHTFSGSG